MGIQPLDFIEIGIGDDEFVRPPIRSPRSGGIETEYNKASIRERLCRVHTEGKSSLLNKRSIGSINDKLVLSDRDVNSILVCRRPQRHLQLSRALSACTERQNEFAGSVKLKEDVSLVIDNELPHGSHSVLNEIGSLLGDLQMGSKDGGCILRGSYGIFDDFHAVLERPHNGVTSMTSEKPRDTKCDHPPFNITRHGRPPCLLGFLSVSDPQDKDLFPQHGVYDPIISHAKLAKPGIPALQGGIRFRFF